MRIKIKIQDKFLSLIEGWNWKEKTNLLKRLKKQ